MFIKLAYIDGKSPSWLEKECGSYCQNVRKPWKLTMHSLPLSKYHARDTAKAINQESKSLLDYSEGQIRVILKAGADQFDSLSFANWLSKISQSTSNIIFLLGGPNGMNDKVSEQSDFSISLSSMTWPHTIARLMICEQIYRASTIIYGGKYHK